MGLLTKILDEKKSAVEKKEIFASSPVAEAQGHPEKCPNCQNSAWWWDRYGGGPHCQVCRPWPSKAMVARTSGGSGEKSQATDPGGRQSESRELGEVKSLRIPDVADMTTEEFGQYFRWYETRPDKDGHGVRLVIERRDWKPEYHMIDQ